MQEAPFVTVIGVYMLAEHLDNAMHHCCFRGIIRRTQALPVPDLLDCPYGLALE
jgi:hypothetical protein